VRSAVRSRLALGAGLTAIVIAFGALVVLDRRNGTLRDGVVPDTVVWFLVAWIGWAVAMLAIERFARPATRSTTRWTVPWPSLIALGLVLRVAMAFTEPTLSDDVYRYLWDGHLVTEGVSPYAFPPSSPSAERYDIAILAQVNNATLASPYLPVAHVIFGASAVVLPPEPWTMQAVMIGFDLLGLVFLIRLLRMAGIAEHRAMLYWLNPLVIVEVAHGAHIDAVIVGLGLAGVYFTLRSGRRHDAPLVVGPPAGRGVPRSPAR
jgi:membrane associated rhomboid family serine protease